LVSRSALLLPAPRPNFGAAARSRAGIVRLRSKPSAAASRSCITIGVDTMHDPIRDDDLP